MLERKGRKDRMGRKEKLEKRLRKVGEEEMGEKEKRSQVEKNLAQVLSRINSKEASFNAIYA